MDLLYISILESIYLIYMFLYFKTSINFDILKIEWSSDFFNHLTDDTYGLRICPFGRQIIWVLIFILLFRNVYTLEKKYIRYSLYTALGLSLLMNWNALVYILPIFIIEKQFNNV